MIAVVVVLYCALLGLNIWIILIRPARPWTAKFGLLFQILGMYTFAFGLVTQTGILPRTIAAEMTSPDLFKFLRGNFAALSTAFAAMSMGLEPAKTSFSAFASLELFGTLGLSLIGAVYAMFQLLVIVPLSYIAYVLVSLPISAIMTSANDMRFTIGEETISVQNVVSTHQVVIKNFLIAFPALAMKTCLELAATYRRAPAESPAQRASWLMRHPRARRSGLLASQIALGVLLFMSAVFALLLPLLVADEPDGVVPIGELVGAEIALALIIWALVVGVARTRRRLKQFATAPAFESV